ncbi:MAG: tryptophan--tRNA ligase, partial [Candidatus Hodarchaeales archaeon]
GKLFFCIADIESYLDGKIPLEEAKKNAIENIADLIALGLNLEEAYVYRQSQEKNVLKLANLLSAHVTYNTMKAIYGENKFGVYNAALTQVADILLPQLKMGPIPTIVPIGADQAPHARLTRDLTRKKAIQDNYNFVLPSFTYHKLIKGLDNSCKMSKRNPLSVLTLFESKKSIKTKISNAYTGGRITLEEQKTLGGNPKDCRIFDLYNFFFQENNSKLKDLYLRCKEGKILCGKDKKNLITLVEDFIALHKKKRLDALPKAREIVLERNDVG